MKKFLSIIVVLMIVLSLCSCGKTGDESSADSDNSIVESTYETLFSDYSEINGKSNLTTEKADENDTASYEVEILDNDGTGEPVTYADLCEYLNDYINLQFISYEIISVYDPDEAYEITGMDMFLRETTLYNAHVTYDWLQNCEVDYYLNIAHVGNSEKQNYGEPMFEVGMQFVAAVFGRFDTWRVPICELEYLVRDEEGTTMAYHIGTSEFLASEEILSLEANLSSSESVTYYAASNNPMLFTSKVDLSELGEFIRNDWEERGFLDAKGDDTQ